MFYTGSEGEPWSPRLHPIFFFLPDADNEEAVRRKTCCVAVALGAFRFTNSSCSFLTTVSVIGCEIIDVSRPPPDPRLPPPPPPPAQAN